MRKLMMSGLPSLALVLPLAIALPAVAAVDSDRPEDVIEHTVQSLIDEFTADRERFDADRGALFALVDRTVAPLFDFRRITRLVLAKNFRGASAEQRVAFREALRKSMVGTYATAMFKYTGNEKMKFLGSEVTERKGRQFAKVKSEVDLGRGGAPVAVDYSMIRDKKDGQWRIYNLIINELNMVANLRGTYDALVTTHGLDGVIETMQRTNAANNL